MSFHLLTKRPMEKPTVPSIQRKEWLEMIQGEITHSFSNYVLQIQIHQLRKDIRKGIITEVQAVEKLHALCDKFSLAVQTDLKAIFKTWEI